MLVARKTVVRREAPPSRSERGRPEGRVAHSSIADALARAGPPLTLPRSRRASISSTSASRGSVPRTERGFIGLPTGCGFTLVDHEREAAAAAAATSTAQRTGTHPTVRGTPALAR